MSFNIPKALPCITPKLCTKYSFFQSAQLKANKDKPLNELQKVTSIILKNRFNNVNYIKTGLAVQIGALFTTVVQPALAVTGVNNEEDFTWVLIQLAISAFLYFLVAPPIIMNWLRIRWYERKLLEMYFQFMFVFIFFPGMMLWAPFVNFRKFPRDPSMKYPWSIPEDLSKVRDPVRKFPWAQPEDYRQ